MCFELLLELPGLLVVRFCAPNIILQHVFAMRSDKNVKLNKNFRAMNSIS